MQGRGGRLVGLVVGTSLLAACTGGGGGAEEGASEAPSSSPSTPVVSSSSEAAVPVLPDEARGDDDAAAVAFVEHWVELVNYAIATGDIEPAATLSSDCTTCAATLGRIEETFATVEPGRWVVLDAVAQDPQDEDRNSVDRVVTSEVNTDETRTGATGDLALGLRWNGADGWTISWMDAIER